MVRISANTQPLAAQTFYNLVQGGVSYCVMSSGEFIDVEVQRPHRLQKKKLFWQAIALTEQPHASNYLSTKIVEFFNNDCILYADAMIGGKKFAMGISESSGHRPILAILPDQSQDSILSLCEFSLGAGILHLYYTHTNENNRHAGMSASLQRMAFLIAGSPKKVLRHQMIDTNPAYDGMTAAILDSGELRQFEPPTRFTDAMAFIFGARVIDVKIPNADSIDFRHSNDFTQLWIDPSSPIDVELTLDPGS